jgi:hypothetical protein
MERVLSKLVPVLAVMSVLFTFSTCGDNMSDDNGLLEGTITIGPICPVETDPPSSDCLPTAETYKAYPVSIWTSDESRKVARIDPALDGSFGVVLVPGVYLVRLDKDYAVGISNLPLMVVISPLEKTVISISIDTGIR